METAFCSTAGVASGSLNEPLLKIGSQCFREFSSDSNSQGPPLSRGLWRRKEILTPDVIRAINRLTEKRTVKGTGQPHSWVRVTAALSQYQKVNGDMNEWLQNLQLQGWGATGQRPGFWRWLAASFLAFVVQFLPLPLLLTGPTQAWA